MSDIKAAEIAVQLLKKIDLMLEVTKDLWEKEELEPKLGALSITSSSSHFFGSPLIPCSLDMIYSRRQLRKS